MREHWAAECSAEAPRILAVVVLYETSPDQSAAYQSLLAARAQSGQRDIRIVLFDNTPGSSGRCSLAEDVCYEAPGLNLGLANAYNRAVQLAEDEAADWILTLDQDTRLPEDFVAQMSALATRWQKDSSVAAIVPQLVDDSVLLSPRRVRLFRHPAVVRGFKGFHEEEVYALNSAALLRVSGIQELGGFPEDFWLDQLDLWLHHQLHRAGKRVYIAGDIHVQHRLSLLVPETLTPNRFRNFLEAESAFFDLHESPAANLALTATLMFRYLKLRARGAPRELADAIRYQLWQRVSCRKKKRIAEWKQSAAKRWANCRECEIPRSRPRVSVCMAAHNGETFITAQIRSILNQLETSDELIIVDDASTDDTCRIVESLGDSRVRLERNELNQGILRTFERAIMAASGQILFLSDQDDLWSPNKISTVIDAFRANPEIDLVVSDASLIDEKDQETGCSYYAVRGKFRSGILANLIRCRYLGCTMAFRERIRTNVLPFPRGRDVLHDIWIGTANALAGGKTLYIDSPLVQYRRHEANATGNRRLSRTRQLWIRWSLCWSLTGRLWMTRWLSC